MRIYLIFLDKIVFEGSHRHVELIVRVERTGLLPTAGNLSPQVGQPGEMAGSETGLVGIQDDGGGTGV